MDSNFSRILRDKKFWAATFLITWAAALQAHMTWLQKQASFKEKFGKQAQEQNKRNQKEDAIESNIEEFTQAEIMGEHKRMDAERLE